MANYTVASGDTLSTIAQKHGVGISDITGYRSGDPNLIYPGEVLSINQASGLPASSFGGEAVQPVPADFAAPQPPMFQGSQVDASMDTQGLLSQIESQKKLQEEQRKAELDRIQKELDQARAREQEFKSSQEETLSQAEPLSSPFREDMERGERQRLEVERNFFENQKLTNELERLLTESAQLTKRLQETKFPGLAGIQQSERTIRNIESVNGRIAIIEAVMSARNNQIGVALNLIDRAINAVTQDRRDRLGYLDTLFNWYERQRNEEGAKIFNLTKEQKEIFDEQKADLRNEIERGQATADYIKRLMIDPQTAQFIANAGISLNDSVDGINAKMREEAERMEIRDISNQMAMEGYTALPIEAPGAIAIEAGGRTLYFKPPSQELTSERVGGFEVLRDAQGKVISSKAAATTGGSGSAPPKSTAYFTADQQKKLREHGVDLEIANQIYEALIAGVSLEEIRQELRDNDLDPSLLDKFDQATGNRTIGDLDQPKKKTGTSDSSMSDEQLMQFLKTGSVGA